MTNTDDAPRTSRGPSPLMVAAAVAVLMTAYEAAKELFFPGISKWTSHAITIAVTTLLATLASYVVLRYRQRIEARLRKSEEGLRITLDSIGDAVIATDREGLITNLNPVAAQLTGWRTEDARNRPLADVFHIISSVTRLRAENPVEKVLATGMVVGLANHTLLVDRAGVERPIADSGAPIKSDDGTIVGVVIVFRDMSTEYRLQEQLLQSQKLDALGQLTGGVAHDFNNMLGGIMGAADLLKFSVQRDPEAQELVGVILDASRQAAELTSQLLSFSRGRTVHSEPVDVHAVIASAVALLQRTIDKRVNIVTSLTANPCVVVGDPAQIQSMFINMGINAAHAMPAGGELRICTTVRDLDAAACAQYAFDLTPGAHLAIEIRDTGVGIAPANLSRVFDPFFTTKELGHGTGLGLSTVYATVTQHSGAITVTSELGAGSVFRVLLPVQAPTAEPAGASPTTTPGRGRILVVDDEPFIRTTAKRMLSHMGFEVEVASNGSDGLRVFEREAGRFDLVLLDVVMPEMNGADCFHAMRRLSPDVRVLMSSGYTRGADIDQLIAEGVRGLLGKPYDRVQLAQAVNAALESRPS